jgi:hypothetical protein
MVRRIALVILPLCVLACGGTKDFMFDAGPLPGPVQDAGPCSPLAQTNCPSNLKCTIEGDGTPICGPKGDGGPYSDCSVTSGGQVKGDDSKCEAGTACVDLEFTGFTRGNHCFPFCNLDGGTTCPGTGATCFPVGSIPEGFCDVPGL